MAVPWVQLIRWTPQVISLSRELLQRSRRTPPPASDIARIEDRSALAARVAALEENERRQAELIEQMAEQQAVLARAAETLHRQQRLLIAIGLAVAIVLGAAVVWLGLR